MRCARSCLFRSCQGWADLWWRTHALGVYLYRCSVRSETRVGLTAIHLFSQQVHFYALHCSFRLMGTFLTGQRSLHAEVEVKKQEKKCLWMQRDVFLSAQTARRQLDQLSLSFGTGATAKSPTIFDDRAPRLFAKCLLLPSAGSFARLGCSDRDKWIAKCIWTHHCCSLTASCDVSSLAVSVPSVCCYFYNFWLAQVALRGW